MTSAPMQLPVDAEPVAVMVAVIAAWRELRHPRLADLVDRIEELLLAAAPRPALGTSRRLVDVEAWRKLEPAGDPLDFRRLAAAAGCGGKADVLRQVQALAARQDPRLARALLALLERPPYAGAASRELLSAILEELVATRDRRAAVPAEELADRYLGVAPTATGSWMIDELKGVARRLEAAEHEPPTGALAAACAALEARFGVTPAPSDERVRRTLGELLAEVYAAPDQDGPRLVYADALLERGDPRGELIALQIAHARGAITDEGRAREAELLRDPARRAAWAQPLSIYAHCGFERGFPATISLRTRAKFSIDHPAWATITGVHGLAQVSQTVARRVCDLPNLQSVSGLSVSFLEKLCRTPRPWTHVAVDGPRVPSAQALDALPELRSLELRAAEPPPRDYLVRRPLRELTIRIGGLGVLPGTSLDLPPTLVRLDLSSGGALPRMDLAQLVQLEDLRLGYRLPVERLALPASLQRLELRGAEAPLPELSAAKPALRQARLHARSFGSGALRTLASLEELELASFRALSEDALDDLVRLRKLTLSPLRTSIPTGVEIPPRVLARLPSLEELYLTTSDPVELRLDGLPLTHVTWQTCALDLFPPGLPLRRASVGVRYELDQLERFLARYPTLAHLELETWYSAERGRDGVAWWRRVVELLERSSLERCDLGPPNELSTLERDADGLLSRLRLGRTDNRTAELLARALTRVTALESATAVPPKLARLVR